jgi:glycosyltransferase involved in cell wall biosynthesis
VLKVLFIGLVWPEARSSAASQNILSYIELFKQQGHKVCFVSASEKSERSTPLDSLVDEQRSVLLNDSSFDEFVGEYQPNIAVFDRYISEEQFSWRVAEAAPNCLKVLDCEDLHFLRYARHEAYKNQVNPNHFDSVEPYLYSDTCKRELASIWRCDISILLSDFEMDLLEEHFGIPSDLLHHCRFLLPNKDARKDPVYSERRDFITIGNFRHAPNWDAVLTLRSKIWPAIKKHLPDVKCHVYGAYLPPKAKQLENKKLGFLVHGYIEDAEQAIGSSRVLLAPINFGAGIKGKLVDAMRCNTPSVTSPIGSEGLIVATDAETGTATDHKIDLPSWPGAISDISENTDNFVKESIELYQNNARWLEASQGCTQHFNTLFDYEKQSHGLLEKLQKVYANLNQHRNRHFFGQILQHHTTSSTKYMSQWIEAKSKLK